MRRASRRILSVIFMLIFTTASWSGSVHATDYVVNPYAVETQTKTKTYTYNYYNKKNVKLATLKVNVNISYSRSDKTVSIVSVTTKLSGQYKANFKIDSARKYDYHNGKSAAYMMVYYQSSLLDDYTYTASYTGSVIQTVPDYSNLTTNTVTVPY